MDTKIIAIVAVAVVAVAAVAVVVANMDDNFNGVIYDGNGGETLDGNKTFRLTSTEVQDSVFEYADHVFTVWNTKADGTGDSYKPGDKISYPSNGNVKLYAQWGDALVISWSSIGSYDFKFKTIDSDGNVDDLDKHLGPVAIPKDGFFGIIVSDHGGIKWELKNTVMKDGKVVNGEFVGTEITGKEGDQVTKVYTLTIKTSDASYTELELTSGKAPTFYFKFDSHATMNVSVVVDNRYVAYNGNGGLTADGKEVFKTIDTTIADNMFQKEGYDFAGWNTKRDGTGETYAVGQIVSIDEKSVGLFAQWETKS